MRLSKNRKVAAAALAGALTLACTSGGTTPASGRLIRAAQTMAAETTDLSVARTIAPVQAGAAAHAVNDGEIQLGQLAAGSASAAAVRDFAQMMITEHANASAQLTTNGYGKGENLITAELNAMVAEQRTALQSRSGADFDRAYMDSQIAMHQAAIDLLTQSLIPSASDPNLRTVLQSMRDHANAHLQRAREIRGSLG